MAAQSNPPTAANGSTAGQSMPALREGISVLMQDSLGRVTVQPDVVAKIAGLAIREVSGVHALVPFSTGQAITNLSRNLTNTDYRNLGVHVEVGQVEAAIDARIITDYGESIPRIVHGIRENVTARIEGMTGLKVKEINLDVVDLFFDEDLHAPVAAPRVQ